MLKKADSTLISACRVLSESFSILSRSGKGVISRDSVGFVVGEVDFGIRSYYGVVKGFLSS